MSITTVLALLSLILLFVPFKNNNVRLVIAVAALIIAVTNLYNNFSSPSKADQSAKEELYAQRIEIIEKGKNSTDPDVIKMVEEVRADIAKEELNTPEEQNHSILDDYEAQPTWVKVAIPLLVLLTISGYVFMLYKLHFAMLTGRI